VNSIPSDGLWVPRLSDRWRMRVAEPQSALQPLQADQGRNEQKKVLWHSLVQLETCLAL